MQTLAKYLFGLLLFLLASLFKNEPVKQEITDSCTAVEYKTLKVCTLKEDLEVHI